MDCVLQNGHKEVKRLAKFLGMDAGEELCKAILDKCTFNTMIQNYIMPVLCISGRSQGG